MQKRRSVTIIPMYNPNPVKENPKNYKVVKITSVEEREEEIVKVSVVLKEKSKNTSVRCTVDKELYDKLEDAKNALKIWAVKEAVTIVTPTPKPKPKKGVRKDKKGALQNPSSPVANSGRSSSGNDGENGAAAGAALTPPKAKGKVHFDVREDKSKKDSPDISAQEEEEDLPLEKEKDDDLVIEEEDDDLVAEKEKDDLSDTSTVEDDSDKDSTKDLTGVCAFTLVIFSFLSYTR